MFSDGYSSHKRNLTGRYRVLSAILTVKDLSISFGSNHVLKSINFELGENEVLGVIGPNGAGKTVMLNPDRYFETNRWYHDF